jgi:hypothetical protein
MSSFDAQGCGCCAGPAEVTAIYNRPALPAIEYRIGTYQSFIDSMITAAAAKPELEAWTSRSPRDFGMQFVAMWAHLADILTFYQERIANEAYLRTATQRENVMRLAAALDYRLGPGAAAGVYLAFTLDKDKTLTLPVGLKSQSVPSQSEKPQKFETVEEVAVDARWNRIRVFPQPVGVTPFAVGRTGGILENEPVRARPLAIGTKVAVFSSTLVENKEIAALRKTDVGTKVEWSLPVKANLVNPEGRPYVRQFRLFGSQAPAQYVQTVVDQSAPNNVRWEVQSNSFEVSASTTTFSLELLAEDLKSGCEMLLVYTNSSDGFVRKGTVLSIGPAPATFGTLQSTVTQVQLQFSGPAPAVSKVDLRKLTLYELAGPAIQLAVSEYPLTIAGNRVFVPLAFLAGYPAKRTIILDDGSPCPHIATVDSAKVTGQHLEIGFTPALPRPYSTDTCVMLGNVVKATHGETVKNEILGNGDAASRLQKFVLKKYPVTFVPQPGAPNGVVDTLKVRIDSVLWTEVTTLLGAAPEARVYTTSVADDGKMTVQFGGEPGSRLPSGRNNVVAEYRQGLGPDGTVRAGAITTLLDRPAGLKSVANPAPSSGGAAPEPVGTARTNAPNTVRTFGRIVSLTDFEDAARELASVAKAKSALSWTGQEQEVSVAVAGEGGEILSATVLSDVLADLNSRRDVNRRLSVRGHQKVPVRIGGRVQVDKAYLLDVVQAAVQTALLGLFHFDHRDLAEPAFKIDVFRVVQAVAGVVAVDLDRLSYRDAASLPLEDVLTARWFEILSLDLADIGMSVQFETL